MAEEEDNKIRKPVSLNFNCIYQVNIDNRNSENLKKVIAEFNNLPLFQKGERAKRGKGFDEFEEDFDIEFVIKPRLFENQEDSTLLHKMRYTLSISDKNILAKRFRYEKYREGRKEPELREADIFWIKPRDILLIKGSEEACEMINSYLMRFKTAGFIPIEFDHEFLLWMCYKYEKFNGKLSDVLQFVRIDKSRTQGTDSHENDIRVKECEGWMIPIPTLYGLLNKQELSHIGGDFKLKTENKKYTINAKLATDLSIYVYSEHALKGVTYSEKCAYSFPFVLELIEIFREWDKRKEYDDKYPDDKFFDDAIESFQQQIEYSIERIGKLKEKYRNKRNGVENVP